MQADFLPSIDNPFEIIDYVVGKKMKVFTLKERVMLYNPYDKYRESITITGTLSKKLLRGYVADVNKLKERDLTRARRVISILSKNYEDLYGMYVDYEVDEDVLKEVEDSLRLAMLRVRIVLASEYLFETDIDLSDDVYDVLDYIEVNGTEECVLVEAVHRLENLVNER